MPYLERKLDPIVDAAEKYMKNKNYSNAVYACTALMEELTKALDFCDDSDGFIGGVINHACEMLYEIAQKNKSKGVREKLFDYCITAFKDKLFEGWDWHIEILKVACELVTDEKEADLVLNCLDKTSGEYEKRRAEVLKLEIISRYKGNEEVQKFVAKHIENPSIREGEIKKAIENKNFEKAVKLCKDAIKSDQKDRPGLVGDWYDWLLEIALLQKDTIKIVEYARFRLINNFYPTRDYYAILKQHVPPTKWKNFLEDIIKEVKTKSIWFADDLIRKIYVEEKWWDRLLLHLKANASLDAIEREEKYLRKDYSEELIQLYSDELMSYVKVSIGRKHYQRACRYLRRMKKLGGKKRVKELIQYFKEAYPRRRALLEELSRV